MGRIADWLLGVQRAEESPETGFEASVTPPARTERSKHVDPNRAFSLSMVYRAVGIIAVASKQLSIDVERGGVALEGYDYPLLVAKPNVFTPRSVFVEQTVVSLAARGNAYWRITRDARGVRNLEVLNPLDVTIEQSKRGVPIGYRYRGESLELDDVQHLALLRVPGSPYGLGPIQAAQSELSGALELRDYANNWFTSGDMPTGILKSDSPLTQEQAEAARKRWEDSRQGRRGVAVFGSGIDYRPIYLSPRDAQFLESQQFTTTQMARLFGVPASLMLASVEGGSQTYANVEQDWLGFVRFSLMQYLVEIEDALTTILPRGQRARFNVEALLRADTLTRYQAHEIAIRSGFMTTNEARAIEHLPPLPTAQGDSNA